MSAHAELAVVAAAWADLPPVLRAGIMAMVAAAQGQPAAKREK